MIDGMFLHIGELLGAPEYTVSRMKIRNNSAVTTLPPTWDDFTRGNLLTSSKTEVTQAKTMRIKHTLMKIGMTGDTPDGLRKARAKNKTEARPIIENGMTDMKESRIERHHQEKERDRVRVVRCDQQEQ